MMIRRLTATAYFVATILAALCYLGAIRPSAVWTYILPGTVIAAIATSLPRKSNSYAGLISGVGCGMVWAVIVNSLSGENLGPAARSTTMCVIGVALVVGGIRRREPHTSMVGHLMILFGALYYGSANEVWKLALVASIFQLAGYIGTSTVAQRRQPQRRSRRQFLSLLILFFMSIMIIFTTSWTLPGILQRDNPQVSELVASSDVKPPWQSPSSAATLTTTTTPTTTTSLPVSTLNPNIDPTTTTTSQVTATSQVTTTSIPETVVKKKKASHLWFWILLLIIALVFVTLSRLLYVRLKNLSELQKFASEDNCESVQLAWNWSLANLHRYQFEVPKSIAIERVATSEQVRTWPSSMQFTITGLATLAEVAVFSNQPMSEEDKNSAWSTSAALISDARNHSSRLRRIAAPFVRVRL